jgi:D-glycero-alpha-D-manno-heptose 1-phosphate guanylyltransferase
VKFQHIDKPHTVIILAGGLGTRLRSVVNDQPKSMAPVHGRPFLSFLMDYWIDQGIENFVLSVGYLSDQIQSYFGARYRNYPITYVVETTPLGTGGGLRKVLLDLQWQQNHVVLINGDTWYPVDLLKICAASRLPITIALKPLSENQRYAGVTVNVNEQVTAFGVGADGPCLINGGCYLINIPPIIDQLRNYPANFSLEQDFLIQLADKGLIGASIQDVSFLDIGIPTDYSRATALLITSQSL